MLSFFIQSAGVMADTAAAANTQAAGDITVTNPVHIIIAAVGLLAAFDAVLYVRRSRKPRAIDYLALSKIPRRSKSDS